MENRQNQNNRFEKKSVITLVVFFIIVFIIALAGLETYLSYRHASKNVISRNGVKRFIRLRENPPLMINNILERKEGGAETLKKFRVDENGFIQPSRIHDDPDMNIFFIGGSTTECATVKEESRFPYLTGRLLEEGLNKRINSYNSGVAGNNSMHSINILLNKIIPMKPDVVIMMHNINDMAILWHEDTYWNQSNTRSLIVEQVRAPVTFMDSTVKRILPHLFLKLSVVSEAISKKVSPGQFDEFARTRRNRKTLNKDYGVKEFHQNLETFISICRIRGIVPVLMTQENRIKKEPDEFIRKQVAHYGIEYSVFLEIYESFNEVIREVGQKAGVLVIDLANKIPQEEQYITDFVHFNNAGSELAAEIITRRLVDHLNQR